ncbi:MAG: hypothetical protein V4702_01395 [Patescibacteria group bacterium]
MGERSPEARSESKEVYIGGGDGAPASSLRDRMLALYPESCRRVGGSLGEEKVCYTILFNVDIIQEEVEAGNLTEEEGFAEATELAGIIDENCPGPRSFATTNSLKCGINNNNFDAPVSATHTVEPSTEPN